MRSTRPAEAVAQPARRTDGVFDGQLRLRQSDARGTEAGSALRVVRALTSQQLSPRFRQHHGCRFHGTGLTIPAAAAEDGLKAPAVAAG